MLRKTGQWPFCKKLNATVHFSRALLFKEQIKISVKKNVVVKQIANMYDSPNKLLKFSCKI